MHAQNGEVVRYALFGFRHKILIPSGVAAPIGSGSGGKSHPSKGRSTKVVAITIKVIALNSPELSGPDDNPI